MIGLLSSNNKSRKISVLIMVLMLIAVPIVGTISFTGTVSADGGDNEDGFIVADGSDYTVYKTNPDGTQTSLVTVSGEATNLFNGDQGPSGNIATAGYDTDVTYFDSSGSKQWSYTTSGTAATDVEVTDNYVYYIGYSEIGRLNKSDGSVDWSKSINGNTSSKIIIQNGNVFYATGDDYGSYTVDGSTLNWSNGTYDSDSYTNVIQFLYQDGELWFSEGADLYRVDSSDGTVIDSANDGSMVGGNDSTRTTFTLDENNVYVTNVQDSTTSVYQYSKSDLTTSNWSASLPSKSLGYTGDLLAIDDTEIAKVNKSDGSVKSSTSVDTHTAHKATYDTGVTAPYKSSYTKNISGKVKDTEGSSVANAKVDIYAVDHSKISTDADTSTLNERAEEILNEASNIDPPTSYDPEYDLKEAANNQSATYVGVHTKEDWNKGFAGDIDQVDIDEPVIVHENANNPVVLSVWDATGSAIIQDNIDKQMPGATIKSQQEVKITKLGPDGSDINSYTVKTGKYKTDGFGGLTGSDHYAVPVKLNSGFYEVEHVTDDRTIKYIIAVEPDKQLEVFAEDLKDKSNNLSDRASRIADLKSQSKVQKIETTTDANGNFSVDVPSSMKTVGIVAYKGADVDIDKNTTVADVRDAWEQKEESVDSIYMSTQPEIVNPPASGVTVEVKEVSNPNFADIANAIGKWEFLQDFIDQEAFSDIGGTTPQDIADKTEEEKERLEDDMKDLVEQNKELEDKYEELLEEQNKSEDQLSKSETISMIEEAVNSRSNTTTPDVEDIEVNIDTPDSWEDPQETIEQGTEEATAPIDMTIPFSGTINQDNIDSAVVTAYHSDGSTHILEEDQYSINESMLGSGAVVIEDYQLPSDVHAVTFDVTVAGENTVGDTQQTVENPRPDLGDVPQLEVIDFNTISPDVGEQVVMDVKSEDTAFKSVDAVRAIAPDGTEISATQSNGEFSFTPQQTGSYILEIDVLNRGDQIVTQTVQMKVSSENVDWPENVRMTETQGGPVAIAGDGVESASFEQSGSNATVSLELAKDAPAEVNVYTANSIDRADTDLTIRVLDQSGALADGNQIVNVYTARLSEDATVYRSEEPIHPDTRYGEITQKDSGTVIKTYTSNGEAQVNVDNDPGIVEEQLYRLDVWTSSTSIPFIGGDK